MNKRDVKFVLVKEHWMEWMSEWITVIIVEKNCD